MILGFKTTFDNGTPTYFPEKIIQACWDGYFSVEDMDLKNTRIDPMAFGQQKVQNYPKLHTIRRGERFKKGDKIHLALGVRTKGYHCFAITTCTAVQPIEIYFIESAVHGHLMGVKLEGKRIDMLIPRIANNDGLTIDQFYDWFYKASNQGKEPFKGQIIHWTDHIYKP